MKVIISTKKVNISTEYAFILTGYIAQHKDEGLIRSQTIFKQYNISSEYMLKVMLRLVKGNILQSKRGPHGGYSLARPASKITMLDIIEAIEGPIDLLSHMDKYAQNDKFCRKIDLAYKKATAKIKNTLKQAKLSDLV